MKMKRKLACVAAMATMAISMSGLSASAYQVSQSNATFSWGYGWATMHNNSTTKRYGQAIVDVYDNVTGVRVDQKAPGANLAFNDSVTASSSYTDSSYYNFTCRGTIYRSNTTNSPLDWSPSYNL